MGRRPDADKLLIQSPDQRLSLALRALSDPLNLDVGHRKRDLRGHYFHDWSRDPFALGAYTYTPTHALDARSELAEPVQRTIFFAGEAGATAGDHGTVHGALASGYLAARKVIEAIANEGGVPLGGDLT